MGGKWGRMFHSGRLQVCKCKNESAGGCLFMQMQEYCVNLKCGVFVCHYLSKILIYINKQKLSLGFSRLETMKDVFIDKKRFNESKPRCHREIFLQPVTFFKICQSFKLADDFRVRWSLGSLNCLQKQ